MKGSLDWRVCHRLDAESCGVVCKRWIRSGEHRILIEQLEEVVVVVSEGEIREIEREDVGPRGDEVETFEVMHLGWSERL